ncbi:LysR family transcriptional regulator [Shewanella nanhaiensis]|uniref:LysR family transcriptional regulator n=1 Tax=Shewanella nanhaiensis TaxID=2864872 RepID=A0ABS7E4R3_9GAMM|nr:LysR family transcriptional regulator [Shewanella nanhaiensis]MBW8184333.1 LysR family transcriptional regulator [Shewanella nanhaiensis]
MDKLSAMRSFEAVARTSSFTEAANQLNTSQATVSKKVLLLEKELDCQLINRSSRKLSLTDDGKTYYEQCKKSLSDIDNIENQLRNSKNSEKGTVKITAPIPFASRVLVPLFPDFYKKHPDIKIEMILSDTQEDIISKSFDIAIRANRHFDDSSLIALSLCKNPLWLIASPEYIKHHGKPIKPKDLKQHNFINYTLFKSYRNLTLTKDNKSENVNVNGNLASNNGDAILASVINGIGIGELPIWMIEEHIKNGSLIRVLPEYIASEVPFKILYPVRDRIPLRVKLLIDYLRVNLKNR